MQEGNGAKRPSGQPLWSPDTNPGVKTLLNGHSRMPLSHSTHKEGQNGPAMTSIAQ